LEGVTFSASSATVRLFSGAAARFLSSFAEGTAIVYFVAKTVCTPSVGHIVSAKGTAIPKARQPAFVAMSTEA